jgi:DNA invertase Pin-like site-specific DNA recombinase
VAVSAAVLAIKGSKMPIRVAIYARISTDDKGQDPESELMQLRAWCGENRHAVVGQYIDLCTDDPQAHQALFSVIHAFANLKEQQTSRRIKVGLRRARTNGKRLGRAPFSRAQLEKLQGALDTGANWLKVSRRTGIPYSTVKKHAHRLGYEPPGRGALGSW